MLTSSKARDKTVEAKVQEEKKNGRQSLAAGSTRVPVPATFINLFQERGWRANLTASTLTAGMCMGQTFEYFRKAMILYTVGRDRDNGSTSDTRQDVSHSIGMVWLIS